MPAQVSQVQVTAHAHLSQQLSHSRSHSNRSAKAGSAASFASMSGGGNVAGPSRKKPRLG